MKIPATGAGMGNAHPEITVPGRANYLVIAYK